MNLNFTSLLAPLGLTGMAAELTVAFAIILAFVAVAKGLYVFLDRYIRRWAAKTKTTLDDRLLGAIEKPFDLTILLIGIYIALFQISALAPYIGFIIQVFTAVWVLIGLWFALRITNALLGWFVAEEAPKKKIKAEAILPPVNKIIKIFIIAIAAVVLLGTFGVEITGLVAGLGIAGLAVALAFQDTLSNFFAGVYTTIERPIKVGDYIELESGQKGYVVDIGWRHTKIRTLPNNIVIIPNIKLASSILTNYYGPRPEMSVVIPVGVAYGSNLKKVEKVTIDVAKKILKSVPGGKKDFKPFIRYHTFGNSSIDFSVILRVEKPVDKYLVTHEFMKALTARYKKEKIEIPFPQRDVWVKQMAKAK